MSAPAPPSLTTFSLLSFDVYGTLMDWETGLYAAAAPLLAKPSPNCTTPLSRSEFLRLHCSLETEQQAATPGLLYSALLSTVYMQLASALSLPPPSQAEADAYGASIKDWLPFPDTADALRRLGKHYKLVVLSNVDAVSFATSARKMGPEGTFDAVLTAQEIGSYKPDLRNFEFLLKTVRERFGVEKEAVLHTAQSLSHDHVPAAEMGIRSAWISRGEAAIGVGESEEEERNMGNWEWRWNTLGEMADAVDEAFKAK